MEVCKLIFLTLKMAAMLLQLRAFGADARAPRTVLPAAQNAGGEEMSLAVGMLDPVRGNRAHAHAPGATLALAFGAHPWGNDAGASSCSPFVDGRGDSTRATPA
jgi:hypothetical protein